MKKGILLMVKILKLEKRQVRDEVLRRKSLKMVIFKSVCYATFAFTTNSAALFTFSFRSKCLRCDSTVCLLINKW